MNAKSNEALCSLIQTAFDMGDTQQFIKMCQQFVKTNISKGNRLAGKADHEKTQAIIWGALKRVAELTRRQKRVSATLCQQCLDSSASQQGGINGND